MGLLGLRFGPLRLRLRLLFRLLLLRLMLWLLLWLLWRLTLALSFFVRICSSPDAMQG